MPLLTTRAAQALGIAALLVFPFVITSPYYLLLLVVIGITAIVALGLDVVFGYTGEVSLGHAALFGIGAYTAGVLAFQLGWGIGPSLIAGPLVAALFGAILAFPALRVTGPYLAMVTLAFGTIVQILINEMTFLTNGPLGISLRQPVYFDWRDWSDTFPFLGMSIARLRQVQNYYVVMACLLVCLVVIGRLTRSRFGRAFEALRDSPIASDCMGVSVYRYKVLAFVISAGFAGLAGVLFAYSVQYLSPNNFGFELTITFLLAVTVGGRKSRSGPLIGAAIVVLLPNILADIVLFRYLAGLIAVIALVAGGVRMARRPEERLRTAIPVVLCLAFFAFSLLLTSVTDYKLTIFGLMILFVVYYLPDGIFGWLRQSLAKLRPGLAGGHAVLTEHGSAETAWTAPPAVADRAKPLLELRGVTMQFGGLKALDNVSLEVLPNTVHGLIGPNGSGKSTTMNVLTGIYAPTEGEILFLGERIAGHTPSRIAAAGISRTFQNVQLFAELTCAENVMVGLHHSYGGSALGVALGLPAEARAERAARVRAMSLLEFVGLQDLANEEARNLPYGKMRLLEIARALALDPRLLLLDEPAAGLTQPDLVELTRIIGRIRDHGITMILIEHHVDLVMSVCDMVTVLDFGQVISEGLPAQVQSDERVISAYLGGPVVDAAEQPHA